MLYTFENMQVYRQGKFHKESVSLDITSTSEVTLPAEHSCFLFPGFVDVHVHLREPGFFYKETIKSGTMASARGGYTEVFSMPNLNPVPDSPENLKVQTDIIEKDAVIGVHPYCSITIGEKDITMSFSSY